MRLLKRLARRYGWIAAGAALLLALPPVLHGLAVPIRFHQFMIHRLEAGQGTLAPGDAWRRVRSVYASGWNALWNRPARTAPGFDDVQGMFAHVFSWVPGHAVVYPTEGFYYFKLSVDGRRVWGNLRVAELDAGRLMMAYFDADTHEVRMLTIGSGDGLAVRRHSDHLYDVTYRDRSVRFEISDIATLPLRGTTLMTDEEFIGRVHDESGLRFALLFNRGTGAFYYLLDEESGVCDRLVPLTGRLLVGARSHFAFYDDIETGRKLLVGVALRHIRANDFFDGPGDQVPYRANLRSPLAIAYPGTRLGDGTDDHGVFLNSPEWCRVAISPYLRYGTIDEVKERIDAIDPTMAPAARWTGLTREWWNTPEYLRAVLGRLDLEGKDTSRIRSSLGRIQPH